jgi:BirA family biotin operon repressor/biotin-[acetyl-CoA-carboxylase] ligase
LASLAACEAIEVLTDTHPFVRWPNDLVIGERKVAGVLAESTPLDDGRRAVVIGIGINCLQQVGHFDAELAAKATSLEIESQSAIDRVAIARELVLRLDARWAGAGIADGLKESRAAWLARCNDRGSPVTLRTRHGMQRGTIVDIDVDGGLLVHLDSGERCVFEAATTTRIWEPA